MSWLYGCPFPTQTRFCRHQQSLIEFPAELEVEGLAERTGGGGIAGADMVLAGIGGEGVFEAEIEIVQDIEAHHR